MEFDRVLISGANGFIGSQLVEHLQKSLDPSRIFPLTRRAILGSRRTVRMDFSKRGWNAILQRLRPSVVFHAAGGSNGTVDDLVAGNILTTLHLFQAMAEVRFPLRAVILGSAAEYGRTEQRCSATTTPLRPASPYAWTKACQTLLAGQAAQSGLDIVVGRLFNLTGPGLPSHFAVGSFARQIAEAEQKGSKQLQVGHLNTYRDFLDIRDAVAGLIQIARFGKSGHIYDVCSGVGRRMGTVLAMLLKDSRQSLKIRRQRNPPTKVDIPCSLGDPRHLKGLKWKPTISFEQSLTDTLNYYRLKAIIPHQ